MADPLRTIVLDGSWRRPPIPGIPRTPPLDAYRRNGPLFIQGPPGPAGPTGPRGYPGDYGRVRYGEMMGSPVTTMQADTPTPFVVTAPRVLDDGLVQPFQGFTFLDAGNVLRARKAGDSYLLSVRLSVRPQVASGYFALDLTVAGNVLGTAGSVASRNVPLTVPAGTVQRVDEDILVNPAAGFVANGAMLTMRCTVPVTLSEEVLFIVPLVAAA